jgi:hypothetical protein
MKCVADPLFGASIRGVESTMVNDDFGRWIHYSKLC